MTAKPIMESDYLNKAMSWSSTDIMLLISEIEERHSVWNVLSTDYKDRNKRVDAWREVANALKRDQAEESKIAIVSTA